MITNAFEEVIAPQKNPDINTAHSDILNKMSLPRWTILKCPYCKEDMPETAIRSITLKLNPRNIGDICVEFLCNKCSVGNTLYFVKAAKSITDFIDLLQDSKKPTSEPIIEEEMYKQKYHNTLEAMIRKET
jgi:hypothetical protein